MQNQITEIPFVVKAQGSIVLRFISLPKGSESKSSCSAGEPWSHEERTYFLGEEKVQRRMLGCCKVRIHSPSLLCALTWHSVVSTVLSLDSLDGCCQDTSTHTLADSRIIPISEARRRLPNELTTQENTGISQVLWSFTETWIDEKASYVSHSHLWGIWDFFFLMPKSPLH